MPRTSRSTPIREMIERPGETPHASGLKPVEGQLVAPVSLQVELGPFGIATGSELPPWHPVAIAGGSIRTTSTGGDNEYAQYQRAIGQPRVRLAGALHALRRRGHRDPVAGRRGPGQHQDHDPRQRPVDDAARRQRGQRLDQQHRSRAGNQRLRRPALCALTATGHQSIARIYVEDDSLNYYGLTNAYVHSAEIDYGFTVNIKQAWGPGSQALPWCDDVQARAGYAGPEHLQPTRHQVARKTVRVTVYNTDLTWNVLEPTVSGDYILWDGTFTIRECKKAVLAGQRVWELDLIAAFPRCRATAAASAAPRTACCASAPTPRPDPHHNVRSPHEPLHPPDLDPRVSPGPRAARPQRAAP